MMELLFETNNFSQDVWAFLWELMSDEKVWIAILVLVNPKAARQKALSEKSNL